LQLDYTLSPSTGKPISVSEVLRNKEKRFGHWTKQHRVVKDFMVLDEKDDFETAIRWAQLAILNPNIDHERFIPGSPYANELGLERASAILPESDFSPNIVALEIRGPELPDLSFYDLPGLIRSLEQMDKAFLVEVVKNLTKEYISHKRAIIICAIPMTNDVELSETFKVIREMNAVNRTIAVLTKADMLSASAGSTDTGTRWLEMLRGNTWKTGLGYFMTARRPDLLLEELKTWEHSFFADELPSTWSEDLSDFDAQLGLEELKKFLSGQLAEAFGQR
jgi:hypothetical protein